MELKITPTWVTTTSCWDTLKFKINVNYIIK